MLRKGLSGNQMKLFAAVSMTLDHIGYLLEAVVLPTMSGTGASCEALRLFARALRMVGRAAFPIFAFLLVEGFFHTRDRAKYGLRLAAFAVLSEAPFDWLESGRVPNWGVQNVFVTLFLGFLMMELFERLKRRIPGQNTFNDYRNPLFFAQAAVAVLIGGVSWLARGDYDYAGILLIAMCYWLRWTPAALCVTGAAWLALMEPRLYYLPGIIPGFLVIHLYNGARGAWKGKYFFYLFYPLHMAALAWVFR